MVLSYNPIYLLLYGAHNLSVGFAYLPTKINKFLKINWSVWKCTAGSCWRYNVFFSTFLYELLARAETIKILIWPFPIYMYTMAVSGIGSAKKQQRTNKEKLRKRHKRAHTSPTVFVAGNVRTVERHKSLIELHWKC